MKEQIKEVQAYFKSKMLNGEFTISKMGQYQATLLVDDFPFIIWIANVSKIPETCKNYNMALSFMDLEFNREEAEKLSTILSPAIKKFRKTELINEKRKELEELERELATAI